MFAQTLYTGTREENYETVTQQLEALITGEQDMIANLSNASALLNQFLDDINWVGFYLWKENELVLGPFQGLPACIRIPSGRGVCGTAVEQKITMLIENVHEFPGHIACDPQSKSEIVIPMIKNDEVIGVLDIDSPNYNRFDKIDETYLEKFVGTLMKQI
ncbi:MAG TPA: GAF domain-containing protein [Candidatus Pseudogracilibacillus intestinigallinarum]|uniref:GAF domain-containing protein n=1 Tax=Candidatus Pseudogracilibacillus intestinigallinarum TaxID=2838742 RepID=A0A9D1PMF1_9BACI|nr:GAF domain-containing protein [Candidatus Pseudogracilibacillus intestinigallinarum]